VQLNCQLINNVLYAQRIRVVPKLTLDYNNCKSNIFDRCNRLYDQSFQANEKSLFLDYIYSNSYSYISRRYLISFAVKRDFFYSFFDFEENDLDQESRVKILRNNIVKIKNKDKNRDNIIGNRDCIASNKQINTNIVNLDDKDIQIASYYLLTSGNLSDTKEENIRENTRKSRRTQSIE